MPLGVRIASRLLVGERGVDRGAGGGALAVTGRDVRGVLRGVGEVDGLAGGQQRLAELERLVGVGGVEGDDVRERLHRRARGQAAEVRVQVALELGVRTSNGAAEVGAVICTVVAPSAWTAAIAATYCALVLLIDADPLAGQRVRLQAAQVVRRRSARSAVAGSSGSGPAIACSSAAASATVRVIGPGRVLRGGDRQDAGAGDEADRRPQAHDPLRRRRADDRAARSRCRS